jgi:perosamine synthetase
MIKVFNPKVTFFDKFSILSSLFKNEISGSSNEIKKFEKALSFYFDRKYSVAVSNGSNALDVAFKLLDLKKGDEVILPSFTIISCLSAVIRSGAVPVFCDVDPISWNMTIEDVQKVYSPKTKVILMVHTYGLVADAVKIQKFCEEKNLKLLEDAAEAHGQKVGNIKCGSIGDISTLSFYANKHITTGEGGAILTNNKQFSLRAKQMINLDFNSKKRFVHNNLFWNYRMSGIQAAMGISQLKNINNVVKSKIAQGKYYSALFKKYDVNVQIPAPNVGSTNNHYWVYGIVLENKIDRESVMKKLFELNIETRPFFWPLHLQPVVKNLDIQNNHYKNSEKLGKSGFYIPMGKHVSKSNQKKIVLKIKSIIEEEN